MMKNHITDVSIRYVYFIISLSIRYGQQAINRDGYVFNSTTILIYNFTFYCNLCRYSNVN